MNNQRQSGWSNFGPRPRVSIESSRKSESRFRSKHMVKIDKECQKHGVNMKYMNLCKSNHHVNDQQANVVKDGTKMSKPAQNRELSRKSKVKAVSRVLVANRDDSNKEKGRQDEVMTKEKGMIGHASKGRATSANQHKQTDTTKTNEAPNSRSLLIGRKHVQGLGSNLGDNSSHVTGKNYLRHQRDTTSFVEGSNCARFSSKQVLQNEKLPNRIQLVGGNKKTKDDKFRRRKQPLLEKMTSAPMIKRGRSIETNRDEVYHGYQNPFGVENECEGVEQLGTFKPKKKWRKDLEMDKYEDDLCDQHRLRVEAGTNELTQVATSKHCVEQQCYRCSKPIDKPKWSGIFRIDGKEYITLAGHYSTKSCEKVHKLTLPSVVQVTKVPRLAAWPNIWKASKPTGDSIGLYFFPHEMRHDEELYQLVKEVMDKDLVLRAVTDEAEMLIFPSVLLPERHQTFQTKHYLWAAFKAKEDKCAVMVEQEEDKGKHASSQLDEVQSEESDQEMILMKCAQPLENQQLPARSTREVETCCIQGPNNMRLECEASGERRLRDSPHQAVCNSPSTGTATDATTVANAPTVPCEATSFAANTTFPANHGPMDPSMEAPPLSSSVFGIVIRQTMNQNPKVQQFIQEMECDGALVSVVQGEAIAAGQWSSNITTAMQ